MSLAARVFDYDSPEGWVQIDDENGFFEDKPCVTDPVNKGVVNFSYYPTGYFKHCHRHDCSHGTYVIDGTLKTEEGNFGRGTFVFDPEGYCGGHGALPDSDCKFIWINNKAGGIHYLDPQNLPESAARFRTSIFHVEDPDGWEKVKAGSGEILVRPLITDQETGQTFSFVRFPADFDFPLHHFTADLSAFVIAGTFRTPLWQVRANQMQFIPAGYREETGAGPEGCTLFVTSPRKAELLYDHEAE